VTQTAKVVLISGSDPRELITGHRTYVRAHALAAKAAGYSPQVFIVSDRNAVEDTDFGTVHLVASPIRPFYTLTAPAHQPFLARGVVRYLSAHPEPHLIHSFGAWSATGVAASRAAARKGIEVVPIASVYTTLDHEADAKVRGLGDQHNVARRLEYRSIRLWTRAVAVPTERWGYRGSRLLLVNYESVCRLVRAQCGPSVEIRRVPYAAPAAFEAPADLARAVPEAVAALRPADAPLIVSVSRHDPRKGVDVLLRALAALAAAGVPFRACLVGSGALLADHRRLRHALSLDGNVAITGHVPDAIDYLRQADVFVLPSLQEGSGSVSLLEALQAGVAVVASDCDGIPEDVTRGRDALLVPPGDWRALRDALAGLLTDEPLRARLAAQARQVYEQRFTPEGFVSGLAELYEELGFGAPGAL
jgi:glycosyltransferase involved in cell wall biosynthesis